LESKDIIVFSLHSDYNKTFILKKSKQYARIAILSIKTFYRVQSVRFAAVISLLIVWFGCCEPQYRVCQLL